MSNFNPMTFEEIVQLIQNDMDTLSDAEFLGKWKLTKEEAVANNPSAGLCVHPVLHTSPTSAKGNVSPPRNRSNSSKRKNRINWNIPLKVIGSLIIPLYFYGAVWLFNDILHLSPFLSILITFGVPALLGLVIWFFITLQSTLGEVQRNASWICDRCGRENLGGDRCSYCYYGRREWICQCGKVNSGAGRCKYCGSPEH